MDRWRLCIHWIKLGKTKLWFSSWSFYHFCFVSRVPFIRDGLINTNKVKPELIRSSTPLKDINILEIGCGAGILTEQLARLHANVTAIDPGTDVIDAAKEHLEQTTRTIDRNISNFISYKVHSMESHLDENPDTKYDAVVVSEVLEHVNDKSAFLEACTRPLKVLPTFSSSIVH